MNANAPVASDLTPTSARITATIDGNGGATINQHGVVYSKTNLTPTLADGKVEIGSTNGPFPLLAGATLTGLEANTSYYARAYATNDKGTAYSSAITFKTALPAPTYTFATHVTGSTNILGNTSTISTAALNNNANAILIITANWEGGNVYNKNPVGVYYTGGQWRVFNQNLTAMPTGLKYNLLITNPTDQAFKHVATAANSSGNTTILDHPLLNDKPGARLLVTQRWNGTYNNSAVGVWYSSGRWRIFNQTFSRPIVPGAEFNVVIDNGIFTTEAQAGKITGNHFLIEPAVPASTSYVFLTHYWTSVYNTQEVGVWKPSTWSIYNQDNSVNMPVGSKFFVLTR
ncbi:MAG: hypothetical protein EAZ91_21620 [Cytophagales bacterium]|nr:MAG: hypothetical protein EAZ91_21620 [Cytophagales bacterium]